MSSPAPTPAPDPTGLGPDMPVWAIAVLFAILTFISTVWDVAVHLLENLLRRKQKDGLLAVVAAVKNELLAFGVLSLVLKVSQPGLAQICIPATPDTVVDATCAKFDDPCAPKGMRQLYSQKTSNNVHLLIFMVAASHLVLAGVTITLCSIKVSRWKKWEGQSSHLPMRPGPQPRWWTSLPLWVRCFVRQYTTSVSQLEYVAIRRTLLNQLHMVSQLEEEPLFPYHAFLLTTTEQQMTRLIRLEWFVWLLALALVGVASHLQWVMLLAQLLMACVLLLVCGTRLQVALVSMGSKYRASMSFAMQVRGHLQADTRIKLHALRSSFPGSGRLPGSRWPTMGRKPGGVEEEAEAEEHQGHSQVTFSLPGQDHHPDAATAETATGAAENQGAVHAEGSSFAAAVQDKETQQQEDSANGSGLIRAGPSIGGVTAGDEISHAEDTVSKCSQSIAPQAAASQDGPTVSCSSAAEEAAVSGGPPPTDCSSGLAGEVAAGTSAASPPSAAAGCGGHLAGPGTTSMGSSIAVQALATESVSALTWLDRTPRHLSKVAVAGREMSMEVCVDTPVTSDGLTPVVRVPSHNKTVRLQHPEGTLSCVGEDWEASHPPSDSKLRTWCRQLRNAVLPWLTNMRGSWGGSASSRAAAALRSNKRPGVLTHPNLLLLVYKLAYFQVAFALAYTLYEVFVQGQGIQGSDILGAFSSDVRGASSAVSPVIVLLVLLGLICAMTLHSAWCVLPVFTLCTMGRQETLAAAAQYLANMERHTAAQVPELYLATRLSSPSSSRNLSACTSRRFDATSVAVRGSRETFSRTPSMLRGATSTAGLPHAE